jgi:hypothetical protein
MCHGMSPTTRLKCVNIASNIIHVYQLYLGTLSTDDQCLRNVEWQRRLSCPNPFLIIERHSLPRLSIYCPQTFEPQPLARSLTQT